MLQPMEADYLSYCHLRQIDQPQELLDQFNKAQIKPKKVTLHNRRALPHNKQVFVPTSENIKSAEN
ncbi:hypothetical protein CROQUDRAFT_97367 [Cronartium quercuum f. sp. fusiforme G11]|uniref:Uncharacterized protein n=1 Tax=Cronartium quercuum f. sp. fusiforme G11 TaxID=708437 RepID=A0A9P6T8G9_9BASI|nr:hypothetical protein CROQUDRAFT_97367 [Cronartium quercuum f. sp. fusiforme G11]